MEDKDKGMLLKPASEGEDPGMSLPANVDHCDASLNARLLSVIAAHNTSPSPVTEKALESLESLLKDFEPKTAAEEKLADIHAAAVLPRTGSPVLAGSPDTRTCAADFGLGTTSNAEFGKEFEDLSAAFGFSTVDSNKSMSICSDTLCNASLDATPVGSFSNTNSFLVPSTPSGSFSAIVNDDTSALIKTLSNSSGRRKSVSKSKEPTGPKVARVGKIGLCAMDAKVLSKPCRRILNRLIENGEFETIVFGDKVILDEAIENWPTCDFLVSFFSSGFPLDKAISYVEYRKPYLINDLILQKALWDRRLVLALLNHANVPTPERLEISRDGGPQLDESLIQKLTTSGITEEQLAALTDQVEPEWELIDDDILRVGDKQMRKPYVEKPVDGEDHNVFIYYPKSTGGGGRKLFRKIGNKSSEFDPDLCQPRTEGSYIYEKFMDTDNFEDVKAYTVGPNFCHAETRKSPVVDGIVRRNTHGKEIRFVTELTEEEKTIAKNVSRIFQQTICGFDLLRVNGLSYVIDVNGFSFVKDNDGYYDSCARILRDLFIEAKKRRDFIKTKIPRLSKLLHKSQFEEKEQKWVLKGFVSVIRHADRTPKQKFKYSFRNPVFISLLKGHKEEVIIRAVPDLQIVLETVKLAIDKKLEDGKKLLQLRGALEKKMNFPGTKIQLKPSLNSENPDIVDKVQLILKWGGEPTHSARNQAHDFGEQMRQDIKLLNRDALKDVKVYTSSERRVIASAHLSTTALLGLDKEHETLPDDFLIIRKDLLDDSNAAKDLMDKVKKKLKPLLRQGAEAPTHFTWPPQMPQPFEVIKRVCVLMNFHRQIMEYNFENHHLYDYEGDWCCGEDPQLFRERWDKLFQEFVNVEKTHPSKISELYDTMKYDALHNRQFLEKAFSLDPNDEKLLEKLRKTCGDTFNSPGLVSEYPINILAMNNFKIPDSHSLVISSSNSSTSTSISSAANGSSSFSSPSSAGSLGWVLRGESLGDASTKHKRTTKIGPNPFDDPNFARLRELYRLSKVLFDFICPQEYGIKDEEKLDIGLLTSLPLAKLILADIQAIKNHDGAAVVNYFTKESHIYTLLNVIYGALLPMKIARNALPELDYLSQILFELYEAGDPSSPSGKKHSIRLSISPGCHTQDPLDVQLDEDHYIGYIPRINLTRHLDMDLVTQRLRSRFSRVLLPKRFTPVNISSPLSSGLS